MSGLKRHSCVWGYRVPPEWVHNNTQLAQLADVAHAALDSTVTHSEGKASGHIDKGHVVQVWEIRKVDMITKKVTNPVNPIIFSMSFRSAWDGRVIVVWIWVGNDENRGNAERIQASRQGIFIWC